MLIVNLPNDRQLELDLVVTYKVIQECEEKHSLTAINSKIKPSVAFLKTLASELGKVLDLQFKLTPAIAWQVWLAVYSARESQAKRFEAECDIAFWYSINPFELSDEQKLAMLANIGRVKAQQRINDGNINAKTAEDAYNLMLLATGSEMVARRFRGDWIESHTEANTPKGKR